ncbi:hypothetical protein CIW47_22170 [Mycolicibacterium sp. P1-5]|nr:hypothetical protein CIW47_22170 [Mycolicibacterium sp. P1-5]
MATDGDDVRRPGEVTAPAAVAAVAEQSGAAAVACPAVFDRLQSVAATTTVAEQHAATTTVLADPAVEAVAYQQTRVGMGRGAVTDVDGDERADLVADGFWCWERRHCGGLPMNTDVHDARARVHDDRGGRGGTDNSGHD